MGDKTTSASGTTSIGSGKPKRRMPKTRNVGHKGHSLSKSKKCEDAVHKLKGQLVEKENAGASKTLLSLLTHGRISQKAGLFGKSKTSDTILRRKPLWSMKESGSDRNNDLCELLHRTPSPHSVGRLSPPPPPTKEQAEMDYSPDESSKQKVPLQEITDRLVGALDISGDTVFPDSKDYFTSIKAELRKIMKQNDPYAYSQLESSLSGVVCPAHSPSLSDDPCFSLSSEQDYCQPFLTSTTPTVRMDTVQATGSPSLPLLSSPVLPIWPHIQNTVCNSSDYQSSSSVLHEPCPDFLDMLDSEVGNTVEVTDSATGIKNEDNSPERPKMYPHKLY